MNISLFILIEFLSALSLKEKNETLKIALNKVVFLDPVDLTFDNDTQGD